MRKLVLVLVAAVTLSACGQDELEEWNDSPVEGNLDTPAMRISFPDGFGNVAAKCFGTTLLFSSRISTDPASGRGITAVANAEVCADGILTRNEIPGAD